MKSSHLTRRVGGPTAALVALILAGCATTTTSLPPTSGARTYSIECMRLGECLAEAQRACGGQFHTIKRTQNQIPESELPGFNEVTESHTRSHGGLRRAMPSGVSANGPGIESDSPMPLDEVVVVCGA